MNEADIDFDSDHYSSPSQRCRAYGISRETWRALSATSLDAGAELMLLGKFRSGPGCALTLLFPDYALLIVVQERISLFLYPTLDIVQPETLVDRAEDCESGWSQMRRAIAEVNA